MKLGTHVHYTETSNFSYCSKPDYAWGGCGSHFPKWPLSPKLRGTEPSISTRYIGFVRRIFQKKYCQMYHHHHHHEQSDVTCCALTELSGDVSRGSRILHLAFHPTRSWHIDSSCLMELMSRRFMCMSLLDKYC